MTEDPAPSRCTDLDNEPWEVRKQLRDAGVSDEDAAQWLDGWVCRLDALVVVSQAVAFARHGQISVTEALCWHQEGFFMPEAGCWAEAAYTPSQARQARHLLQPPDSPSDLLGSGLRPDRAVAYLRAGFTVAEAASREASDPVDDNTLTLLAALGRHAGSVGTAVLSGTESSLSLT